MYISITILIYAFLLCSRWPQKSQGNLNSKPPLWSNCGGMGRVRSSYVITQEVFCVAILIRSTAVPTSLRHVFFLASMVVEFGMDNHLHKGKKRFVEHKILVSCYMISIVTCQANVEIEKVRKTMTRDCVYLYKYIYIYIYIS
jgi:hypothetical protein